MNKKHKTYSQFIIMVMWLLLSAIGTGVVYKIARRRPPVSYENLTSDILDRFNKQGQGLTDFGGRFVDDLLMLEDWDNEHDLGANDSLGWENVQDANFIVYYKPDMNGAWKQNAELTLKQANKAIPDLKATFGKYIYPKDINNRKLPIYLPSAPSAFGKLASELSGGSCNTSGALGITIYMVSPSGFLPQGIVIKSSVFDSQVDLANSIFCVLPHELSHYVYAGLYDYDSGNTPLNWVSEGVAEYVAQRNVQIQGQDTINFISNECNLTADFPSSRSRFANSEYWAGESFFNFVKEKYGRNHVSKFVTATYKHNVADALASAFEGKDMHEEWIDFLTEKVPSVEGTEEGD